MFIVIGNNSESRQVEAFAQHPNHAYKPPLSGLESFDYFSLLSF
jgi:hypothetical protein